MSSTLQRFAGQNRRMPARQMQEEQLVAFSS